MNGTVGVVDVARVVAVLSARVDAEPGQRLPERGQLVTLALRRAFRLDGVRVADEPELAVEIEPEVGGRDLQRADLEARAAFVAGPRREARDGRIGFTTPRASFEWNPLPQLP